MSLYHPHQDIYSIVIAVHPDNEPSVKGQDWRLGDITVDWVDFTREKSTDVRERGEHQSQENTSPKKHRNRHNRGNGSPSNSSDRVHVPGSAPQGSTTTNTYSSMAKPARPKRSNGRDSERDREPPRALTAEEMSQQPLLAHIPGPNPMEASAAAQGITHVGKGVVHLFKHSPPASLIARLEGQNGESSRGFGPKDEEGRDWAGDQAEGEDGSLVAILAVPAWMRPSDLLEFLGGWAVCLEGVRMIREAISPNRSIVLLKFRDPLQASDFMVIFTGRAFSTLDARETCHPMRIHHLVLHKLEEGSKEVGGGDLPIPAFPPSVYASRARALGDLLKGVPSSKRYELPSCPVCLERLDSTVTGLVTLPCAHTFDCDCLRKWGDSRCPVCRVSHLLLSAQDDKKNSRRRRAAERRDDDPTRFTQCGMCDSTENSWICVVCGAVGCGRYSKGHARLHWEESGHSLAMELETQRVWDYKGDNYVHRLIQDRTDGKLVELPSASSLITPSTSRRTLPLNQPLDHGSAMSTPSRNGVHPHSRPHSPATPDLGRFHSATANSRSSSPFGANDGPSNNDMEKMSTIEAITLEYSYLLSSQLEAMRQHYEAESSQQKETIAKLEAAAARTQEAEQAAHSAQSKCQEAESLREKAERRAEKAIEVTRGLQSSLGSEKAMSEGLNVRIKKLREEIEAIRLSRDEKAAEVESLSETVRDLMFTLEAGVKIQEAGGDGGEGGDLMVLGGGKGKKKGKRK